MANGKGTLSLKKESVLPIKSERYLTDVIEETENAQDVTRAGEGKSNPQTDLDITLSQCFDEEVHVMQHARWHQMQKREAEKNYKKCKASCPMCPLTQVMHTSRLATPQG